MEDDEIESWWRARELEDEQQRGNVAARAMAAFPPPSPRQLLVECDACGRTFHRGRANCPSCGNCSSCG